MPIYTIPGRQKPILVQGDQMDQFWERHSDAKLQAEAGGKKYSVSKDEFNYFKEDFPDFKSEISNTFYNGSYQPQIKADDQNGQMEDGNSNAFTDAVGHVAGTMIKNAIPASRIVEQATGEPIYKTALSYGKDLGTRMAGGALNTLGGAYNFLDKGVKALEKMGLASRGGAFGDTGAWLKQLGQGLVDKSDRYNGKDYEKLIDEKDYTGALGQIMLQGSESTIPSAVAMLTGGAGLATMGIASASDKFDEIRSEYPDVPLTQAIPNALMTGLYEYATEKIGADLFTGALKNTSRAGLKKLGEKLEEGFNKTIRKFMEKHSILGSISEEAVEEMSNAAAEYITDVATGVVEKADPAEFASKVSEAGIYGAAGGAYFAPVAAGVKFMGKRKRNKIVDAYNTASKDASGFLSDNDKAALLDGVYRFQQNGDYANLQSFVNSFAQSRGLNENQYAIVERLAVASIPYNNYVDYVGSQIEEEAKDRINDINRLSNLDTGTMMTARLGENTDPVYVTGGVLVTNDDGTINRDESSDIVYFVGSDGKVQQATPDSFTEIVSNWSLGAMYDEAYSNARHTVLQEEASETSQFAPGQQVMTSNGVAGQVQSIDEEGNVIVNSNGITNVYKPEDLQIMQEQAQPTMQPDVQQEQAPAFPMDKDGNIDFGQISDPQQFADGLKQEFGDAGTAIVDQYIANEQAKLAKTSKAGDPIKAARDKASAQAKLDFYNQVKGAMGTEMGLTGDKNPINPIQQGEEYQSVAEFNANNGISDNPINPINQTENPIEQEAVPGDTQSVDNGIENAPENPTNPTEQEPAKQPTTDDMVADILDGELDDQEVDDYVAENKRAAQNALMVINNKKPKMLTNKAEYLAKRAAWQQEADAAQAEVDRWNEIGAKIAETRKGIGADEAARILSQTEPMNGHELAAKMLADGSIKLTHDSFKRETGGGTGEARGFFGLFARPEKGGVNIERAGEMLMLADLEAGTNFFDQNDPNAGRNAIIDVLSEARTRGDLINYIRNNREEQARREQEAQYNAYAQQIMDEYHMSPDEYEAYERLSEEAARMMTPEQQSEIDGEIYDQIMQEQADEAERMAIFDSLNNNKENGTTETEGDSGTAGSLQEESNGGNEVLPGQQVSDTGRGEFLDKQGDEPVSDNAGQDGGTPKSEAERIKEAESEVDQNPTDAQKEAGNYKKGHVSIKGFDISIENPAGSIRSGVDAGGKRWENKMNNTYGYFKGTQSVDGDHIDVYLSNDMDSWSGENVYVIDQYNPDGSFDEHKVMFGFDNADEALNNFLANYEKGWGDTRRLDVTPISMDGFKEWIDSSHRKTKPFAEYSSIKGKPSVEEQPVQKKWSEMTMDERMKEAETNPLTKEQVEAYTGDDVIKANALAYINGKDDLINSIAYLKVYEDVRNSNGGHTQDNGTKDGTQLAQTDNAVNQTGGLGTRRTGGESAEQMDRGSRTTDVSGKRTDVQNGEGRTDTNAGAQGDSTIPVEGKPVGGSDTRSDGREGSSTDSSNGRDGKRRGSKTGGTASTDTRSRADVSQRKGSKGNDQPKTGRKSVKDIEAERKNALDEFNSILDQFVKAGKKDLSLSLAGLNNEQFEILPKLISAGAKVGYTYIQEGIYKLAEWFPKMKSVLRTPLQKVGFSEDEVDSFIKEMWKCNMPIDGVTHTLEEWAAILGEENLRKEVGKTINEKKQLQDQAESIEVKVGDRQNIEETLPYLLPQQRDDVMKAEVQFFDASHNDRDHGNGKGFMFTNGTGTGKTYTGLGIVKRFIKQGKGRVLIVTPSQTKVNDWIKDASNLNINLRDLDSIAKEKGTTATTEAGDGAVITTFANFRTNKALLESTFDLVVYDESHRILENKSGAGTTGSNQHYMITNRNERYAYDRLWEINPLKKQIEDKFQEFIDEAERIKNNNPSGSDMVGLTLGRLDNNDRASYPKLAEIERQYYDLLTKKETVVDPQLREQAKQEVSKTKVVFLSATPFNTRENLEYAEGYIFSYPEEDKVTAGSYRHKNPRTEFYLQHFGAGYRFRYGHIEAHTKNAEALAKQEVDFSDYLQNELQTMSGRVIDSEYDYSRDFPTVTLGVAERFNEAVQEIKDSDCNHAMYQLLGDYNYSSALFETLKVSCATPRIKEHLAKGRKVIVFHRRVESKNPIVPLFTAYFESEEAMLKNSLKERPNDVELKAALNQLSQLKDKYKDLLDWESTLDMSMPRAQLANEFGADNVLFFSGKESTKVKNQAVDTFNDDNSGKNIIVIQEASGKEGISLHDRTGEHQRALITLALPQSPITALQIEGRIYRIGNKSNAIFEYPLLGLDAEMILFGQRFNNQVGTTENLALGSKARNLRDSFARGVEERSGYIDPETQGFGGKDFDAPFQAEGSEYDRSVLDYYTNQKIRGRRDNREGLDYYPTPEPLGFKMVEWADIREGDSALEPSAGHGAIARYVPRGNSLTAVEPSSSLFAKLQIKVGGSGRKFVNNIFEQYNEVNKHDVVVMNPPFGKAGFTAVQHVLKAFRHLDEGGRLVAIVPKARTANNLEDHMAHFHKDSLFRGEIILPDVVFENAGTKVRCRVVIFDKVGNAKLRQKVSPFKYDMSGKYDKVEDFFEELRDVRVPERIIDRNAILKKRAKSVEADIKENKYIEEYEISDKGIYVSPKRLPFINIYWDGLSEAAWESKLLEHFNRFNEWSNEKDERQAEVGSLMKQVVAKLAGKTEDQMERDVNNVRIEAANKQAGSPSVQTEQPAAPQNDQSAYVYEKKQHTKTGDDMHMAMPKKAGSLSDDEYSRISKIAKNNGGYWNRFMKGFAFKTKEDADRFIAETTPNENDILYREEDNVSNNDPSVDDIISRAKADGTYMKAPNGKPSNLTPRQWAQVRTKAFKDWFGDWELASKVLHVVPALKEHGFNNFDEARSWAKEHIVRTLTNDETGGKGEIRISNTAVAKFLSESSVAKSDSRDVHLSVLKVLPDVIRDSVDAEQHPDYKKGDGGKRSVENGVNNDVIMHRLYGAVSLNDKIYRVKITLKENVRTKETPKAYSYEATKIELLAGQHGDVAMTSPRNSNNSITAANLLQNVEKSYGNGTKLLDSSKVVDENGEPIVVKHVTDSDFTEFSNEKLGENTDLNAADENWAKTAHLGFWFNDQISKEQTMQSKEMSLFLNIRNPYKTRSIQSLANELEGITPEEYIENITDMEYDGIILKDEEFGGTSYVVFEPTQVKSATDNIGTFDATSPDIRYRSEEPLKNDDRMNESEHMIEAGQSFAESLGVAYQVEFVTNKEGLQGKRASAKGFFDRKTGKVTVVVPNHTSIGDMQATILHELVGHYGLRKLFGDKFDDMMDRTFKAMPKELRRAIAEEAISKYRGDVRTATEEYVASIAERGVRDMKMWEKIKAGIKDFFRSIGINLTMRDEDIAYMLWRSKNRLKASDTMLEVAQKIADNADMQSLLYRDGMGFGSMLNTPKVDRNGVVEISEWLKERLKNRSAQRELYLKVREGYQDNMIRVREWQREVERETGHKVQDHEDFYTFKNQTSSRAQFDMQKFQAECGQAIWDEIDKLAQKIGKPAGEGTRMIENYEMVKHGLERNEYMRQQAIDQLQYQATIDIDNAKATLKGKQLQDAIDKITAKLNNEVAKYDNKDYSGLTALSKEILGSDKMDEAALSKWVDDFEKQYNTMPLWKAIREATNRTLQQQLRTGLISKETYDKISGMYKFYIPLKDWDGTRAQDLYEYENGDRDIIQNPLKHAKGRTTRAGNVLANIASAYESATILGYKNLANQRLLNFVRNSGTQSAVASEQWFIKSYDAQGNEYWQPAYASGFNEDPDHNAKVIADFEADMKQKQEQGLAKTVHEVAKLGVPVKAWQEQQHIVKVKEGGVDKTVYFLGDPRVSQAVNGLNNRNYDMWLIRQANNVRKFMMLNYTSRNVTFILRNLLRDISYVPTMSYVKYGWDFTQKYVKWLPKAMKDLAKAEYGGKADPEVENFYKNGGATGYLDSIGYERYKKEIDSLIKASEGKDRLKYLKKIFAAVGIHVERVNNIVENANRYAVYRAAKESGFSELKAIEAAKEASVNFNRRGSGQYGGAIAQNAYFFFNAAIQGTQNFGSAVANNKVRALKVLGFWFALGVAFRSLSGLFGDDDDEYNQLPDYVRQNNLVIPLWKGQYLSIPLSIEIRAVYGLGDMIAQAFQGGYDDNKMGFVSDALLKLMDLAPISIEMPQGRRTSEEMAQSIMKNFVPDAAKPVYDVIFTNENFYGKRITGRNEYNTYIPEWQKASFGTSKALIEASKKLNEATGGDYATKGWADGLLTNPAVAEYLFEQYLGGVGKAFGQAYKTVEAVATGDKVYSRNIPIVSGLTYSTENMVPKDNTSKRYSNYIDDFNEAQSRYKQYQKGVANGEATSEQFTNFVNSPEFMRYQIIGAYKKQVDGINDMRKALDPDDPMNETLAKYALETKRQMIERLKEMEE